MPERNDREKGHIRQNSGDPGGVVSGLEGANVPTDFHIPGVGIEDVDRSVMSLFDSTIEFSVRGRGDIIKKVPVVFATGERFALLNRNKPIRDKEGALILPMISIRRTGIEQGSDDITGRGINQHTGDIVIKRKLSPKDRDYQRLVNKLGLQNQDNVAEFGRPAEPVGSKEKTGSEHESDIVQRGGLLAQLLEDNIFEIITAPQPQFYTATYEIGFWSSYTQHMNEMIERLISAQLPQGRTFRLDTPAGYWFVGYLDESKSSQDNLTDFAETERIIKYTFGLSVKAYLFATQNPGDANPFRRFVSAPRVRFDIFEGIDGDPAVSPHLGADDPTKSFTLEGDMVIARNQFSQRQLDKKKGVARTIQNPFTGDEEKRFVRVLQENKKVGETVFSGEELIKL